MNASDKIQTIANALVEIDEVRALFLTGSHAIGLEDDWSDLDFLLVTSTGASDVSANLWRRAVESLDQIVMWRDRVVRPTLINAITRDWTRLDVILAGPSDMARYAQDALRVVFDKDGTFETLTPNTKTIRMSNSRLAYQIDEFIRIFGLLNLVLGRKEYINGVAGLAHLRTILVEVMVELHDAPNRGGMLHLNRLLSAAQQDTLRALPAPRPDRDALIEAHLAYWQAFVPEAKALSQERGVAWPTDFEASTKAMLARNAGITVSD